MGSTLTKAQTFLRAYVTDGVPGSGANQPSKTDGIAAFADADSRLTGLESTVTSGLITEDTWAHLSGITGTTIGEGAAVLNDSGMHTDPVVSGTVPNQGTYAWSASPAGWKWIAAEPLDIAPSTDGFNFTDSFGDDGGLRLTQEGPELAGGRHSQGKGELRLADRFGLTHGNCGDFTHWEVRARDARAVAKSASDRAAFDSTSQRPTFGYNHFITDGQSLEEGSSAQTTHDALSTTGEFGSLMLGTAPGCATEVNTTFDAVGSSTLNSLVAVANNVNRGEAPGVAAVNMFRYLWLQSQGVSADTSRLCVLTTCGVGGKTVAQLSSGGSPNYFGKVSSAISQIQTLATAASKTVGCAAIKWFQGENDYASVTTLAAYMTGLATLIASIRAALVSGYSQAGIPAVFTYQTSGSWILTDTLWLSICQAQWLLSQQQQNWYMVGPSYPYPHYTGDGHLTSNGYRWMGNKFGQAMHEVLIRGRTWKPLQPEEAAVMGRTVIVTFSVPHGPLKFAPVYDGFGTSLYATRGFEVYDDNGPLILLGVKILGQATVGLYCDRPLGNNVHVRYGGMTTTGRGNLCDSDSTVALDSYIYSGSGMPGGTAENITALVGNPYPMNNWCVCFDLAAS
jgi:hypothetical protein